MRIGVTGAFGFLGSNFVAALLDAGYSAPTAFSSRVASNPVFDSARVRRVGLDATDEAAMTEAFRGLDAVAHFAGRVDFRAARKREVWDANVLGTRAFLRAARAAGVGRLLVVSSISVLGSARGSRRRSEDDRAYGEAASGIAFSSRDEALDAVGSSLAGDYSFLRRAGAAYGTSKLAALELTLEAVRSAPGGPEIVVIYPGTAVGAGDMHLSIGSLVDRAWEGRMRVVFDGATSFVDARDFARGALAALERGAPGRDYVIGGGVDQDLSYSDFVSLAASLGAAERGREAPRPPIVAPRGLALAVAGAAELAAPAGDLTRALILSGAARNVCGSERARAELGYEPRSSLRDSIRECRRFSESLRLARGVHR